MCRSCRRQYEAELKAQRTAASERRAARVAAQNGVSVNAEPEPEPERVTPPVLPPKRDRLESISDDLKLIIAGHYANYDIPVQTIVSAYHIANGDVTRIADELGVPRRDHRNTGKALPRGHFTDHVWVPDGAPTPPHTNGVVVPTEIVDSVPEDVNKALENMIVRPQIETRPEQLRSTPSPREIEAYSAPRVAPSPPSYVEEILPGRRTWVIAYEGRIIVEADTVDDALAAARADGHITQIIGVSLRSR